MDFIDEQIIHELKEDSRLSMSELSRRIHLSAPAVRERVRQLEEQDIIKRYTIELNQKNWATPLKPSLKRQLKIIVMTILKANMPVFEC